MLNPSGKRRWTSECIVWLTIHRDGMIGIGHRHFLLLVAWNRREKRVRYKNISFIFTTHSLCLLTISHVWRRKNKLFARRSRFDMPPKLEHAWNQSVERAILTVNNMPSSIAWEIICVCCDRANLVCKHKYHYSVMGQHGYILTRICSVVFSSTFNRIKCALLLGGGSVLKW